MLKNLKRILGHSDELTVEIKLTDNCRIETATLGTIDGTAGESYTVTEATANQLVGADRAVIPARDEAIAARSVKLNGLLPPLGEPAPLPDGWAGLPKSFADWWTLNEQGLLLIRRRDAIEEILIARTYNRAVLDVGDLEKINLSAQLDVIGRMGAGSPPDPEELAIQRRLNDALARAKDAAADWLAEHSDELLRLKITCGDSVMEAHGNLARTCRELAKVGLAIFETRIAALGLGRGRIEELFGGSADALKFTHDPGNLDDLRLAYMGENGQARVYLDKEMEQLAYLRRSYEPRAAELSKLLTSAKAELARAQKAASLAA